MKKEVSFVYGMLLCNRPIFKIGKANEPYDRHKKIKKDWGKICTDDIYLIECYKDKVHVAIEPLTLAVYGCIPF